MVDCTSWSRRDQEEGGELDPHKDVRLSFAGPDLKRSKEIKKREVELGSESCTFLPQLFFNSSATDSVFVTDPHCS